MFSSKVIMDKGFTIFSFIQTRKVRDCRPKIIVFELHDFFYKKLVYKQLS